MRFGSWNVRLGIETTCDETAASVVLRGLRMSAAEFSQHRAVADRRTSALWRVVPEIAARAHVEVLDHLIARAMSEAGLSFNVLDGIAAAAGPGLIGGVIVGLTTAKASRWCARSH